MYDPAAGKVAAFVAAAVCFVLMVAVAVAVMGQPTPPPTPECSVCCDPAAVCAATSAWPPLSACENRKHQVAQICVVVVDVARVRPQEIEAQSCGLICSFGIEINK
ncbi:hypothetical protein BRADI_3g41875v3 [Brachypodium distachyon]|uniref:Bifunctional inhibitor/plant lipid transfer protein/seed storage helical domain-containing protein n=1 Tax=Brachypodium distachyon TaxID=15368 RepID=A0A2K2D2M5_BRADI|nr:hypothetical protein BRADI_3g41875v3 [Brachypodium distachyon]